jgi:hypothetical protein
MHDGEHSLRAQTLKPANSLHLGPPQSAHASRGHCRGGAILIAAPISLRHARPDPQLRSSSAGGNRYTDASQVRLRGRQIHLATTANEHAQVGVSVRPAVDKRWPWGTFREQCLAWLLADHQGSIRHRPHGRLGRQSNMRLLRPRRQRIPPRRQTCSSAGPPSNAGASVPATTDGLTLQPGSLLQRQHRPLHLRRPLGFSGDANLYHMGNNPLTHRSDRPATARLGVNDPYGSDRRRDAVIESRPLPS